YVIDGLARVYECTVDTRGSITARFYFVEPVTEGSSITSGSATVDRLRELANGVSQKAGTGDFEVLVTKHYPDTTHAKTTEFRMKQKASISTIYEHVHRVWAQEKGRGDQNLLIIKGG
ncbi:MAG: hypothetical protein AAF236_16455, partial [Verrucomicrobiota bacterium]